MRMGLYILPHQTTYVLINFDDIQYGEMYLFDSVAY